MSFSEKKGIPFIDWPDWSLPSPPPFFMKEGKTLLLAFRVSGRRLRGRGFGTTIALTESIQMVLPLVMCQ